MEQEKSLGCFDCVLGLPLCGIPQTSLSIVQGWGIELRGPLDDDMDPSLRSGLRK